MPGGRKPRFRPKSIDLINASDSSQPDLSDAPETKISLRVSRHIGRFACSPPCHEKGVEFIKVSDLNPIALGIKARKNEFCAQTLSLEPGQKKAMEREFASH